MMECDAELLPDADFVEELGMRLVNRSISGEGLDKATTDLARAAVVAQSRNRLAVRFTPTRFVSWDHRKIR